MLIIVSVWPKKLEFENMLTSMLINKPVPYLPTRSLANAPAPLQTEVASRSAAFTAPVPLRVAVGTYNINSGKHFRGSIQLHFNRIIYYR